MKADSLAHDWNRRLAILETELKSSGSSAWPAHLEIRVLRFLLARYPEGRGALAAQAPRVFVSPLAFIGSPSVRPAKCQRMQLLRHIAQVNRSVREKKLSDTEQFLQDFDRSVEAQMFKARVRRAQKAKEQDQRDQNKRGK